MCAGLQEKKGIMSLDSELTTILLWSINIITIMRTPDIRQIMGRVWRNLGNSTKAMLQIAGN